jgi:hypothetical protein
MPVSVGWVNDIILGSGSSSTPHPDPERSAEDALSFNEFLGSLDQAGLDAYLNGGGTQETSGGGGGGGGKKGGGGGGGGGKIKQIGEISQYGNEEITDKLDQMILDDDTDYLAQDVISEYQDEAEDIRRRMEEARGTLAELDPETQAYFQDMLDHEMAMLDDSFQSNKDDLLVRIFGSGSEGSNISAQYGSELISKQGLAEGQARGQIAQMKIGTRQFLTDQGLQNLLAQQAGVGEARGAAMEQYGMQLQAEASRRQSAYQLRAGLEQTYAQRYSAEMSKIAQIKSAKISARAQVASARLSANAVRSSAMSQLEGIKYSTRATLLSNIYSTEGGLALDFYKTDVAYKTGMDSLAMTKRDQNMQMNIAAMEMVAGMAGGSDIVLKQDIEPIEDALAKIKELKGVTWEWRSTVGGPGHVGVIAQDVEKVLPELVGKVGPWKTVDYQGLIGVLVEAVKTLATRVEELENGV